MRANWKQAKIEDICSHKKGAIAIGPFGSRLKSDNYVDSGVPVIRGTNITGGPKFGGDFVYITEEKASELGSANVYQNDLVFPHRGAIGEVGIVLDDAHYVLSSSLMKLSCDFSKANPKFLYYFFKSRLGKHELLKNASQVGTPGIGQPLTSLKSIELLFPPIKTQNKIASILFGFDQKIELNNQINQTLEAMAQALFKSWFVDFEPVKAKIEARAAGADAEGVTLAAMEAISGQNAEALAKLAQTDSERYAELKATAELFPDALVESELGEIPAGWEVSDLNSICKLNPKSWTKKTAPESVVYVDLSNTKNGVIEQVTEYSWSDAPSRAKRILQKGDTIIGTVRPGNRSFAYIGEMDKKLTASTGFAVLHPKSEIYQEFIYIAATSDQSIDRLAHLADGGAYPAVRPDVVTTFQITLPNNSQIIRIYHQHVSPMFALAEKNKSKQAVLADLRDTLLPKLLSGELSVEDIELAESTQEEHS